MANLYWQVRSRAEIALENPIVWLGIGVVALMVSVSSALMTGSVDVSLASMIDSIGDSSHALHAVIWNVRFPRILCALTVGSSLAVAGALLQTAVRNPLADPGILGVTAGAGLAALIVMLIFPGSMFWLPWAGFAGGMSTTAIMLGLAWTSANDPGPLRIVLSGVALQALLGAFIALLTFSFADRAPSFAAFVVGSLNGLGWADFKIIVAPTVLGLVLAFAFARTLNLLMLEDTAASGLGVAVRRSRFLASCIAALLAASAVSVAGLIGFVGLVVPNGLRLLIGPEHKMLLPFSAVGGGVLVVVADLVARTVLSPLELPVGALLALLGGPYFIYILWTKLP